MFEAAIEIVSYVVPGVAVEVDVFICPDVCEVAVRMLASSLEGDDKSIFLKRDSYRSKMRTEEMEV